MTPNVPSERRGTGGRPTPHSKNLCCLLSARLWGYPIFLKTASNRLVKVKAKSIWGDDEEDLKLLTLSFLHSPIPNLNPVCLEFFFDTVNV